MNGDITVEDWFDQFQEHLHEEGLVEIALLTDQSNADQVTARSRNITAHFLTSIAPEVYTTLKCLIQPLKLNTRTYEQLKEVLINHMSPKPTVLTERFKFAKSSQKSGESLSDYLARLKSIAVKCEFENYNLRIRDQFVFGLCERDAVEALLEEDAGTLTLDNAFKKAISIVRSKQEAQFINTSTGGNDQNFPSNVHSVSREIQCTKCLLPGHIAEKCNTKCFGCREKYHTKRNCPNKGRSRQFNNRQTSFKRNMDDNAKQRYSPTKNSRQGGRSVHAVQNNESNDELLDYEPDLDFGELYKVSMEQQDIEILSNVETVKSEFDHLSSFDVEHLHTAEIFPDKFENCRIVQTNISDSRPLLKTFVNGAELMMEVDSGASVTVCSKETLDVAGVNVVLKPCRMRLSVANGEHLDILGKAKVDVCINGLCKSGMDIYVAQSKVPSLLGRTWISQFCGKNWMSKLWSSVENTNAQDANCDEKDSDVDSTAHVICSKKQPASYLESYFNGKIRSFEELSESVVFEDRVGTVKDVQVRLRLKENAQPISEPPRRVAFAVKEKLEKAYAVSDQGPQFTSQEFGEFTKMNGIRHVLCPTFSPKSNGQIERFVQTFKRAMKKLHEKSSDLDLNLAKFLLTYRNTPHSVTGQPPAVRFKGRTLRSRLHLLRPTDRQVLENLHPERSEKILSGTQKERTFNQNQSVWVQMTADKSWVPATVVGTHGKSPVYDIEFKGRVVKKHADQLKQRVRPVIRIEKHKLTESEKAEIRRNMTPADTPTRDLTSYDESTAVVTPVPDTSNQQVEQANTPLTHHSPGQSSPEVSPTPSQPVRRSERLQNKTKVNYYE